MPAWMAGIQVCGMRPETSMSAWIPALHTGMTESRSRTKTDRDPPPFLFSKEEATKDSFILILLNFVLFAISFAVKCLFLLWLRRRPRCGFCGSDPPQISGVTTAFEKSDFQTRKLFQNASGLVFVILSGGRRPSRAASHLAKGTGDRP